MPSLKDLKVRINSVKSTQKITAAMKLVAAAKLRRAQEAAVAARPYAERMDRVMVSMGARMVGMAGAPKLLSGTGRDEVQLIVVATADRGLCGGFNSSIVRASRALIRRLEAERKTVKVLCIGRKGRDQLRRDYGRLIVGTIEDIGKPRLGFAGADQIAQRLIGMFEAGEFDVCTIIYNKFKSVITQIVTTQQLIPVPLPAAAAAADAPPHALKGGAQAIYEAEPDEETILTRLVPRNLAIQVFRALLENAASEQGARMSAMDNATRNAGEMISKLTLTYNRSRQAYITKELIEIISGAEAV
ncbi:MAG: F0F1 ATP synthase subunit gamma [Proteobacteria bacterium]|nr:F0F1 ATP synthase subunit gamma [Pseudomonadota bacterium]MBI3496559.1 F0F1 ATP synthase subunit gamma [Pseudomonadota bacterium]